MREQARLAKAMVESYARTSQDRVNSMRAMSDSATKDRLRSVVNPPDISGSLKKAGVLLLIPPDPITDVAGLAMIGAAYALKSRKPLSLGSMLAETEKTLRDLQSLF